MIARIREVGRRLNMRRLDETLILYLSILVVIYEVGSTAEKDRMP